MPKGNKIEYIPLGRRSALRGPLPYPPTSATPHSRSIEQDKADAWPVLLRASKASFGDTEILYFTTEKLEGMPERYASRITIKVPDGPERAFPWSSTAPSVIDARNNAATKAVRAGAIQYILQWLPPRILKLETAKPAVKKPKLLVVEREKPADALNARLRPFGAQGSQSWAFCQLEQGVSAVLTVSLPSGRLVYGCPETPAGRNVQLAKQATLDLAFKKGLIPLIMAELRSRAGTKFASS